MDSFYDVPRRAPVPTPIEKFLAAPVVPEVSMICPTKVPTNSFMPYHNWKMQQNCNDSRNVLTSNRENVIRGPAFNQFTGHQDTSHLFKKQVRFESPVLQQRPSLTYEPLNTRSDIPKDNNAQSTGQKLIGGRANESPLSGKNFAEIYMANVPTRQLDLSIIELPNLKKTSKQPVVLEERQEEVQNNRILNKDTHLESEINKNKENELPKTYREFLETQKKIAKENKVDPNDSVTDIFNYKKNKNFTGSPNNLQVKKAVRAYERSDAVLCTKILPEASPKEIKRPDGLVNDHSNPTQNTNGQRWQPQVCNKAQYTTSIIPHKYIESDGYQNRLPHQDSSPKLDTETQTTQIDLQPQRETPKKEPQANESELTNKDLLKIIAQQNEQLLILQKQVAMLLNRDQNCQPKPIEGMPQRTNYIGEKCVTSTQNENFRSPPMQDGASTPRKRGMSKFSIDLMTSFEVAIRPQHNKQNFINYEPKIQEITESESVTTGIGSDRNDKTVVDTSLHLQEPVRVREMCPSPEPSMNINMNDYDSSEDDEVTASEIGATFYHNLMGQVNDILKKAQVQTKENLQARDNCKPAGISDRNRDKTMNRVKEATLKHLKSIGVTIGPMDDDDSLRFENDSKEYTPTEVSFAVKQILMKYLPDDQLAKVTYKQAQGKSVPARKEENAVGIIPARPEFSFASVQYMRKYNLLTNDTKSRDAETVKVPEAPRLEGPKILDITALKMQPKLL